MSFEIFDDIRTRAATNLKRIVFTRTQTAGVLEAAEQIRRRGIAVPILLGNPEEIKDDARGRGVTLTQMVICGHDERQIEKYVRPSLVRWRAGGIGESEARRRLADSDELAVAMILGGDADGVVAGPASMVNSSVPQVVAAAGLAEGCSVMAQSYIVVCENARRGVLVVNSLGHSDLSATQLAEVALGAARNTRRLLGLDPHIALLSLTTLASLEPRRRYQSASDALGQKIWDAAETVRVRDETVQMESQPETSLKCGNGLPNTLVFSELQAGNFRYRLEQEFEGGRVVGPIVQGVGLPVNQIVAGTSADDIIDTAALTALIANGQ